MELIISWCRFFGDWLLFTFPLFQGILDVTEGSELIKHVHGQKKHSHFIFINNLLWLLPPLKIALERRKINQIAKLALNKNINFNQVYRKLNVATAWIYVSFAGVLNGIVATEELLKMYGKGDNWWWLVITNALIILGGLQIVNYFASPKRKNKYFNNLK